MPKPKNIQPAKSHSAPHVSHTPPHTFEDVSPAWLLRAIAITLSSIALFLYLTYAGLFYFGQWQLVLHPSKKITQTPANASIPFETIRFGIDASGQPQLTGWWIPAAAPAANGTNARYENFTLLYLHGAAGSLSDALPALTHLHALGINIFALDYRGYGTSADLHPSQARMTQDAESGFTYLTDARHLLPTQLIPYGDGVGATLAAKLAAEHHAVPVVILRNPPANVLADAANDPRSRMIPVRLIFHERFEIAPTLADLKTPKLLFDMQSDAANPRQNELNSILQSAADPKMSMQVNCGHPGCADKESEAIKRFLDEYLVIQPGTLIPMH